ncbi:hypothetical protein [Prochlorococcus marinus]|uniref:Uncharacterized protein n=1 Tax=Prochlorococcus marinus XMU1408 TaxID=2213228 RepID=A0A318QZ59_PROMR|nr:hypothetical protein [Prochlorococcus marinus]MBW3042571.1 hypothetical protein [Prochlorococcus marinus str. XMU1408]PYE01294.1 hypothetical protein DNJ73_07740 [Prochlorococcus marinus XMU1408]
MFLYPKKNSEFFDENSNFFSTSKLHALDKYWSNNSSHPTHQKIHEMIERILIQRGEKTLKQERISLIKQLEKSFLISNPMGRFSANIIGLITKLLILKNQLK